MAYKEYDIFVSHSSDDMGDVQHLVGQWETWKDYKIFADFNDEQLKEASLKHTMNAELANHLRKAIERSLAFVFVASRNSMSSGWMPWELGLAHGSVGRVHLYRLTPDAMEGCKHEYLQLYEDTTFGPENAQQYLANAVAKARDELNAPADLGRDLDLGKEFARAMNTMITSLFNPFVLFSSGPFNSEVQRADFWR